MAGKKGKEIQLQQEIETQEEWEDMLSKEGLCVIDVYQEWSNPCQAILGTFKRIKNELGDSLLRFAIAKADTVDVLEKYRGRCEPCFLFYAGGVMVAVIRGANAPLILRTITEQLAHEHKVLEGSAERKEIKDTLIAQLEARDKEADEEDEEKEEAVKEVSVVIIKPDAVQSGKSDEILAEMKKRGIEILRQEERQLTEEEVRNVYIHLQDEEYFGDLVTFMTSSPCIVLAITKGKTGENIIKEFRELIGPTEVEEAKEQAPESLRAKFGQEKYMNAVHGSDSNDTAARELAFFFPDFAAPKIEGAPKLQRTLALIRPDAYKNHKDEIIGKIREAGFKIAMQKEVHLNKEQAEEFYKEHEGQDYFDELTDRMSSGPLLALGLAREEAISGWRDMLGPTKVDEAKEQKPDSLRAQFSQEGASINMIHGSDSEETAQKEIEYFFPMEQTVAVIKPDAYGTKDDIIEKIHEAGFRIAARKETTLSREIAEEFYGDHKDKEYYNDLVEHMTSGPTYFMVLSREGAVDGWRSLIGPTNPQEAKENAPDSLRGTFGTDPLRNAVHGSSDPKHAMSQISKIFDESEEKKEEDGRKSPEEAKPEPPKPAEPAEDKQPTPEPEQQEPEPEPEQQEPEPAGETQQQSEDKPVADDTPADTEQQQEAEQTPKEEEKTEEKPAEPEQKPAEEEKKEDPPKVEEVKEEPEPAKEEEKPAETTEETKEEAKTEEAKTEEPKAEEKKEDKPAEGGGE